MCVHAGLCGGSASGKTTVANKIIEALDVPWVVLLSMDSFYKVTLLGIFIKCFVSLVRSTLPGGRNRNQEGVAAISAFHIPKVFCFVAVRGLETSRASGCSSEIVL